MKLRLYLFALLLLFCGGLFAQGNLQFNQAIKLDLVGGQPVAGGANYVQIATQTVNIPVGKVWKIESTTANITKGTFTTSTYNFLFNFGGTPVLYMDDAIIYSAITSTSLTVPHQIYWVPAGSHTFSLWLPTVGSPVTYTYTATITAIEFNIIP